MKKRILYIEDNHLLKDLISTNLNVQFDVDLITADSGNQAIELIKKNERIDLIISDINMPDGSGLDVLEFLIEKQFDVPVIFLSSEVLQFKHLKNKNILALIDKFKMDELFEVIAVNIGQA